MSEALNHRLRSRLWSLANRHSPEIQWMYRLPLRARLDMWRWRRKPHGPVKRYPKMSKWLVERLDAAT